MDLQFLIGRLAPATFEPLDAFANHIEFQPVAIQTRASFTTVFSGTDVASETWFDVRFKTGDSTTDEVELNWQQGGIAVHSLDAGTAPVTYSITGIRKHSEKDDHSSDFTAATATLTVVLP